MRTNATTAVRNVPYSMLLPLIVSTSLSKLGLPNGMAMIGLMMSTTSAVTTAPKAPPMTNATASCTTLPWLRKSRKPFTMSSLSRPSGHPSRGADLRRAQHRDTDARPAAGAPTRYPSRDREAADRPARRRTRRGVEGTEGNACRTAPAGYTAVPQNHGTLPASDRVLARRWHGRRSRGRAGTRSGTRRRSSPGRAVRSMAASAQRASRGW